MLSQFHVTYQLDEKSLYYITLYYITHYITPEMELKLVLDLRPSKACCEDIWIGRNMDEI